MGASKYSPSERLLRKRMAARLRQQRCRARKRQALLARNSSLGETVLTRPVPKKEPSTTTRSDLSRKENISESSSPNNGRLRNTTSLSYVGNHFCGTSVSPMRGSAVVSFDSIATKHIGRATITRSPIFNRNSRPDYIPAVNTTSSSEFSLDSTATEHNGTIARSPIFIRNSRPACIPAIDRTSSPDLSQMIYPQSCSYRILGVGQNPIRRTPSKEETAVEAMLSLSHTGLSTPRRLQPRRPIERPLSYRCFDRQQRCHGLKPSPTRLYPGPLYPGVPRVARNLHF